MGITSASAAKMLPPKPGEFRFVTKALSVTSEGSGDQRVRRFRTIASSTIKDLGKDEMKITALEDMAESFRRGLTIFMNHKYAVPEDVFGRSDSAEIKDSGLRDEKTGSPIWDLHIGGVVNVPNPRAVQLADSIEGGYVTFGTSVGAIVKAHTRNKDGGMDIEHVDCKEGSIVGIPMNQRSWTQKAAQAAVALDESEDECEDCDEQETASEAVVEAEKAVPAEEVTAVVPDTEAVVEAVEADLAHKAQFVEKGDLSAKQRGKLRASQFACPEKRKYPINDAAHVRAALSRVADPNNDQCGKAKILAAARRMGIGEHDKKAYMDDEALLAWAAANPADIPEDFDDLDLDDSPEESVEAVGKGAEDAPEADLTIKEATEGGQEADPAATPETAPTDEDGSDPAIEQKAIEFSTEDVVELSRKAIYLAERNDEISRELAEVKAERDRLAAENKEASVAIEKIMAKPLRPVTVGFVRELDGRLPDFLAPEVKDYLKRTAGDSK